MTEVRLSNLTLIMDESGNYALFKDEKPVPFMSEVEASKLLSMCYEKQLQEINEAPF